MLHVAQYEATRLIAEAQNTMTTFFLPLCIKLFFLHNADSLDNPERRRLCGFSVHHRNIMDKCLEHFT